MRLLNFIDVRERARDPEFLSPPTRFCSHAYAFFFQRNSMARNAPHLHGPGLVETEVRGRTREESVLRLLEQFSQCLLIIVIRRMR